MTLQITDFLASDCPPSFYYISNFIDEDYEKKLLEKFYNAPKTKWTHLRHRRLQNWGGFPNSKGMVVENIPQWLNEVMAKINDLSIFYENGIKCNHALLNEYRVDEGIMPHHDGDLYHPIVATLSLGSHTVLDFYKPLENDIHTDITDRKISSALIEPRSLYIMTGDMYQYYMHGIDGSHTDRVDPAMFCNANLVDQNSFADNYLTRSTRVSFTIRNVPNVINLSKKFKF